MRFHTRRLLFTSRRVERSSFTAATCCSLSFIRASPAPVARERKDPGGKPSIYTLYIYSEVQHISSIHYSLWAAFPCSFVMCFLHRSCSRRTDSAAPFLLFSFSLLFFSFFFLLVALVAPKPIRDTYICITTRSVVPSAREVPFIELCDRAGSARRKATAARRKFTERFYSV